MERRVCKSILSFAGPSLVRCGRGRWLGTGTRLSVRLASHSVKYDWRLGRGRYTESDMGFISQPSLCFLRVPARKYPAVAVVSRSAVPALAVRRRLDRQRQLLM